MHAAPVCQAPFALHDSGVVPPSAGHCVVYGAQLPMHAPLEQALSMHVTGGPYAPPSQVWTPFVSEHVVAPVAQTPHAPPLQYGVAIGQSTGLPHCSFEAHVSTA